MSRKSRDEDRDNYLIRLGVVEPPPLVTFVWGNPIVIPTVRRVAPTVIAEDIVGVQPLTPAAAEVFRITTQRTDVNARPRRLRAQWSVELADDLRYVHNMNIEDLHEE